MALRIASDDDYEAMFGMPAPAAWHGLVAASDWLIEGLGCVYRCTEGRWWLGFARSPDPYCQPLSLLICPLEPEPRDPHFCPADGRVSDRMQRQILAIRMRQ